MEISVNYVALKKCEEEKKEGFETVEVQDSFVYKGVIAQVPKEVPVYIGNRQVCQKTYLAMV